VGRLAQDLLLEFQLGDLLPQPAQFLPLVAADRLLGTAALPASACFAALTQFRSVS
jgi:hypothetical protein